ncbi:hypothetical protein C0J52_04483 [Blattella germanica]|nr:hypothetical protein C0J52_04483 [Blattella germanica]
MAKNVKYGTSPLKICFLWHRKANGVSFFANDKLPSDTTLCQSLFQILTEEKCVPIKFVSIIISKFLKPILDNQAKILTNNNDFSKILNKKPLKRV